MNSMDELDNFSQITSNTDLIQCDSYRAEFYLTKSGLVIKTERQHNREDTPFVSKTKKKRATSNNYQEKRNIFKSQ